MSAYRIDSDPDTHEHDFHQYFASQGNNIADAEPQILVGEGVARRADEPASGPATAQCIAGASLEDREQREPSPLNPSNADAANEYLRRVRGQRPVANDSTLAEVKSSEALWAKRLRNAMWDARCLKNPNSSKPDKRLRWLGDRFWEDKYVTSRCFELVKACIDLHENGFRLHKDFDRARMGKGGKKRNRERDKTMNCAERLGELCNVLRNDKLICEDAMADGNIPIIVNAPLCYAQRKVSCKDSNDTRGGKRKKEKTATKPLVMDPEPASSRPTTSEESESGGSGGSGEQHASNTIPQGLYSLETPIAPWRSSTYPNDLNYESVYNLGNHRYTQQQVDPELTFSYPSPEVYTSMRKHYWPAGRIEPQFPSLNTLNTDHLLGPSQITFDQPIQYQHPQRAPAVPDASSTASRRRLLPLQPRPRADTWHHPQEQLNPICSHNPTTLEQSTSLAYSAQPTAPETVAGSSFYQAPPSGGEARKRRRTAGNSHIM